MTNTSPVPQQSAEIETSPSDKVVLGWTHTARFLTTASELVHLPASELPEIAFVGRSNAGKSTAINTLAQQKRLAFASKTPGRTQHINLFELGPKDAANAWFADLPGYGYAAVAKAAKLRWQKVMADYLAVRRSLSGVVLMVDSRLGLTDLDKQLLEFVEPRLRSGEVKLLVLLTKADKLNRKDADAALFGTRAYMKQLETEASDITVTLFSALKKLGVAKVAQTLHAWVQAARVVTEAEFAAAAAASAESSSESAAAEPVAAPDSGATPPAA